MMDPKDDPTTLGSILLALDLVSEEQLTDAVNKQQKMREETVLGLILVSDGVITSAQLDVALSAQASMRTNGKHGLAMGVANIALHRRRRASVLQKRERLVEKSQQVVQACRRITGNEGTAITANMLAKSKNGD